MPSTTSTSPLLPQRSTRVIVSPDDLRPAFTPNQETDARTAIGRGMKEYLEQLEWHAISGEIVRFKKVYDAWAAPETPAEYPSAAVITEGEGSYDSSKFTPAVDAVAEGTGLVQTCELSIDMTIRLWATDDKERSQLASMLEANLSPTEFMYGVRLELPHYFGARATYEPLRMSYHDTSEEALRRRKLATLTMRCTIPVFRLVKLPVMKAKGQTVPVPDKGSDFQPSGGGISQVFTGRSS